jgi:DNA polymerase III delta prime subunit
MEPLSHHAGVYDKLNSFYTSGKIPHIILHGHHGTGKKTILNWFISKVYEENKTIIKNNVMYVNCAHGKGIRFIREDLKFFAKTNIQSNNGSNFKSIILLNADFLTIDAQSALRRCIELFSHNTRFFIVVENKDKLLKPILSRFCEIYVAECMNENTVVNLNRRLIAGIENALDTEQVERITECLSRLEEEEEEESVTHADIVNASGELYENGYSGLDLIKYISQTKRFDDKKTSAIGVCFNIIKSEYRCENLLLLYMLDYIYLRSKTDIKSVLTL